MGTTASGLACGQLPCCGQPPRKLTWRKAPADSRDRFLAFAPHMKVDLPRKVDLRPKENFPIYDQGTLGSCTANALGAGFHFEMVQQGTSLFTPSRLFIYYNERELEGSTEEDAGAYIKDGIKAMATKGVCSEELWPYNEKKFTTKPTAECYDMAAKHKAKQYAQVPHTLEDMKACLANGYPFSFGFIVFGSFQCVWTALTGKMTMPCCCDPQMGGHAVLACGYDDDKEVFIVRNSWGENWGDKGYFYMPYAFMANQEWTDDLWAVQVVEDDREFPTDTKLEMMPSADGCLRTRFLCAGGAE